MWPFRGRSGSLGTAQPPAAESVGNIVERKSACAWSSLAEDAAREILYQNTVRLYDRAELVALDQRADTVSADYVRMAAHMLQLHPLNQKGADASLALGTTLVGLSGGYLLSLLGGGHPKYDWIVVAAYAVLLLGTILTTAATTTKGRRRT